MRNIILLIGLLLPLASQAEDLWPDQIYLNFATQHFGMGEEVFGINGPNEFNPGFGFGWDNSAKTIKYSIGYYKDSFSHPTLTAGVSKTIFETAHLNIGTGISITKSLGGSQMIEFESGFQEVKARFYSWPYIQVEYKNFYSHLRPGVNHEGKPAGAFAFGFKWELDKFSLVHNSQIN